MNEHLVLVVENDDVRARFVAQVLERGGLQVIRLNEGLGVPDVVVGEAPRAVLVGTDLPDTDVEGLIAEARRVSSVPILVLMDPDDDEATLLGVGADGCVSTFDRVDTLVARVRAIVRMTVRYASEPLPATRVEVGVMTVDTRGRTLTVDDVVVSLSPAEYEVLELLVRRPGAIVERDAMYDELWGTLYDGRDRALDQRVSRLRTKMRPLRKASIRSVRGRGYRLMVGPGEPRPVDGLGPLARSMLGRELAGSLA